MNPTTPLDWILFAVAAGVSFALGFAVTWTLLDWFKHRRQR